VEENEDGKRIVSGFFIPNSVCGWKDISPASLELK
jgi:hypothetical protein